MRPIIPTRPDRPTLPWPLALLLLAACGIASAGVVNPGCTRTWPGASCSGTLQQCITAAPNNCDIHIASNTVLETIFISGKSLRLMAAGGYTPVFGATTTADILVQGGSTSTLVGIDGIEMGNGRLMVLQNSGNLLHVGVSNSVFTAIDAAPSRILVRDIGDFGTGQVRLRLSNNYFTHAPGVENMVAVLVEDVVGPTEITLLSNGFDALHPSRAVVEVVNGIGLLTLEARGNTVRTPFQGSGFGILQGGPGRTVARLVNNIVEGDPFNLLPAGNAVHVDAMAGTTELVLHNNTLAYTGGGVVVQAGAGANLKGLAANNLVAFNQVGLHLPDAVPNSHNLVFGNASDDFVAGPGTVVADPLLVAARGAIGLADGSPAIDAGDPSLLPADIVTDYFGNARISGFGLDIGALELHADGLFRSGFEPDGAM